ncbi:unnamed protein product [Phaedon cochleariae]|uniref:Apolipoprotein D n=1 Tax=Phaedon cochleariae TaxID=80249 RepID=A0A9P0GK04_PHACE|nr:unnamed protein product [Phaedon cochleariae]
MEVIIVVFALVSLVGTYAQSPSSSCPEVSVVQNFNATGYLGKWYEQMKYPFIFELDAKCISAEYSLNPNGTVRVLNQQINIGTGHPNSIEGTARLDSTTGEAKLLVNFPTAPIHFDSPYWVVATDYVSYSVVWSCAEVPLIGKSTHAWILTRERNPSRDLIDKALSVFEKQHLSTTSLLTTDQQDCPKQ